MLNLILSLIALQKTDVKVSSKKTIINDYVLIVFTFALSRAWLLIAGLYPDFEHILTHYQYLDPKLLQENLASSLFFLHGQPPLWNAIVGIFLKLAGGDPPLFIVYYLSFSFLISLFIAFMIYDIVVGLLTQRKLALIASLFYVIFSSAYFYEFYIFYQLFTAFLSTGCVWGVLLLFNENDDKTRLLGLFILLLFPVLLTLTWSIFHPILIPMINILLFFRLKGILSVFKTRKKIVIYAGLIIAVLASFLIPVKNLIVFDYFGSSSWLGLNLAQAAPRENNNVWLLHQCSDFHTVKYREYQIALETVRFNAGSASATQEIFKSDGATPNLNNIGVIFRSRKCANFALEVIRNDFPDYLRGRWNQFIFTSTILSDAYFYYPKGLLKPIVSEMMRMRNLVFIPYQDGYYLGPLIAFNISCFAPLVLWKRWKSLPKGSVEIVVFSLLQIAWVLGIGLLLNGNEQNRMRFTIEPLQIVMVTFFIGAIGTFLKQTFDHDALLKNQRPSSV